MKIASWNVNSIRQRLGHVKDWLAAEQPDVLALQEIKVVTEGFPAGEFEALGYHCAVDGQKAYNGVALLSRLPPAEVACGLPNFEDEQKRVLAASYADLRLFNLYVPNGQSVGSDKYAYKLKWLEALTAWLREELARFPRLALLGDYNIAPEARDVHDPKAWEGQVLFSEAERAAFRSLLELGLKDAFRLFDQPDKTFTWWDYRMMAFRRNMGLRIDHILLSDELAGNCTACSVDKGPRKAERPSDHAPVIAELK